MKLTLLNKVAVKFFAVIMSVVFMFGGYTAPSTETPIDKSSDDVQAVFALIADPQVSNYLFNRYPIFKAAAEDLQNAQCKFDAIIGVGDIAENGLAEEYKLVSDELSKIDTRFIMATGNHDLRLRLYCQSVDRFTSFTNGLNGDDSVDSLHYSEVVGGYKVIVMGSDRTEFEEAYINDEQLQWLDSELATQDGQPTFVILHQPLKDTHNVQVAWNSPNDEAGTVGEQSDEIQAILSKYENVFLITGHLHSGFGPDSYNNVDGIHSINVPSMAIKNADGTYNNAGTGYIVEVYENQVIFRARDYAKGTWVAQTENDASYDIVIDLV